jgi:beta-phosphoglucomutase-like phosphatase (HAD superfamily)
MLPRTRLPRKAHAVVFDMDGLIFNTEAMRGEIIRAAAPAAAALILLWVA